jgi:hypothetical protein
LDADVQFGGLNSERAIGSRFVEVAVAMMRCGIGSVNEMEF